jgi:hypothetical protein
MNGGALPAGYETITVDEAEARFGLSADLDVAYYRSVKEEQEIRLYSGDVRIPGDLDVSDWVGDELCPYNVIVNGDLTVDGDLTYSCDEGVGFFHLVTGSVRADALLLSGFPHVVVRGRLTVTHGILGRYGDDGGFLTVRERARAPVIVNTLYFSMTFGKQPRAVVVADRSNTKCEVDHQGNELRGVLLPELLVDHGPDDDDDDDGYPDDDAIAAALRAGRSILCPDVRPRRTDT